MNSQEYIKNAVKTESVPDRVEMNQITLHAAIQIMIAASQIADMVKRKVFYGKAIKPEALKERLEYAANISTYIAGMADRVIEDPNCPDLINVPYSQAELDASGLPDALRGIKLENINPRLFHAAIGCFTESGELLEAVTNQFETGIIDLVNFGEEIGDIGWYTAIGFDATGVSEEECRAKNIAKLKARYPEKFTADAALNRDLAAERAVLEGSVAAPTTYSGILRDAKADTPV